MTGARVPLLGLGVWQTAAGHETEQAVEWALEAGYRHIDTASLYRNERSVGAALARSGLPREEVFVTTKLMPVRPSAERELQRSLERLGLEYVDLYLIHFPVTGTVGRPPTASGLAQREFGAPGAAPVRPSRIGHALAAGAPFLAMALNAWL